MAIAVTNALTGNQIGFPPNVDPGSGTGCADPRDCCLGQKFCTVIGCVCIGVCLPCITPPPGIGNGGPFPPGNGGPFPPAPPPDQPPVAPPPGQVPQIGTCPPKAGALAAVICGPGCHANKAEYCLKSGERVLKGTRCVRNRRRNPLNPRALDRAISRISSAQNAVSRLGFQKKSPRKKPRAKPKICP